jgi:hypothetical protein
VHDVLGHAAVDLWRLVHRDLRFRPLASLHSPWRLPRRASGAPRIAGAVAGVVAGDALLEIEGRPASALTPIEVRDLLAPMEPGVEP